MDGMKEIARKVSTLSRTAMDMLVLAQRGDSNAKIKEVMRSLECLLMRHQEAPVEVIENLHLMDTALQVYKQEVFDKGIIAVQGENGANMYNAMHGMIWATLWELIATMWQYLLLESKVEDAGTRSRKENNESMGKKCQA